MSWIKSKVSHYVSWQCVQTAVLICEILHFLDNNKFPLRKRLNCHGVMTGKFLSLKGDDSSECDWPSLFQSVMIIMYSIRPTFSTNLSITSAFTMPGFSRQGPLRLSMPCWATTIESSISKWVCFLCLICRLTLTCYMRAKWVLLHGSFSHRDLCCVGADLAGNRIRLSDTQIESPTAQSNPAVLQSSQKWGS